VIKETNKNLKTSRDATDELQRFNQAMFYAQYALQWDSIKDPEALRKWHAFKRRYERKRPMAKRIGSELYLMAKENGYDSQEKQKVLFNKIGDKYTICGMKIKDILYIE
jgi:hypothetical protein